MSMHWNPQTYLQNADYVWKYGEELFTWLAPKPGEHILDLGCGDGTLTSKISAYGCTVVGIDSSAAMVEVARDKGVNASVMDAQKMDFHNQFDAIFSNAALHWIKNADAVIRNTHNALKPNGRFCAELGAQNNVQLIVSSLYAELQKMDLHGDAYNPFYFPSKEEYQQKLADNGFHVIHLEVYERPTPLPTKIIGWLNTFARSFLRDIPVSQQADFMQRVVHNLEPVLKDKNGVWFADYVRCKFLAVKQDDQRTR